MCVDVASLSSIIKYNLRCGGNSEEMWFYWRPNILQGNLVCFHAGSPGTSNSNVSQSKQYESCVCKSVFQTFLFCL